MSPPLKSVNLTFLCSSRLEQIDLLSDLYTRETQGEGEGEVEQLEGSSLRAACQKSDMQSLRTSQRLCKVPEILCDLFGRNDRPQKHIYPGNINHKYF